MAAHAQIFIKEVISYSANSSPDRIIPCPASSTAGLGKQQLLVFPSLLRVCQPCWLLPPPVPAHQQQLHPFSFAIAALQTFSDLMIS